MTNAVQFKKSLLASAQQPMTIEEVYRFVAAYGGIHEVDVTGGVTDSWTQGKYWDSYDPNVWTLSATGIVADNNTLADSYLWARTTTTDPIETPHSFVTEFDAAGAGGIMLRVSSKQTYYLLEWTTTSLSISNVVNNYPYPITVLPVDFSGTMRLAIMFKEHVISTQDNIRWLEIAVWRDGEFITAAADELGTRELGYSLGFKIAAGSEITWAALQIKTLQIPVEFASLDIGTAPATTLQQAIGERNIRDWVRFDGSMVVKRPEKGLRVWRARIREYKQINKSTDLRNMFNHIKVWGTFGYAEAFDSALIQAYGRKFAEINNPNLYTNRDYVIEATALLRKSTSESQTLVFTSVWNPFLEPEDIIEVEGHGYYIINAIDVQLTSSSSSMTVNCRKYVYAE